MTLLSNSSMDYHPLNTTGSFTVQLPRYMYMEGQWEVALTEIHYPYTFANVEDDQNEIQIETIQITPEYIYWYDAGQQGDMDFKTEWNTYQITPGFYSTINDIIAAVNDVVLKATAQENFFKYDPMAHRVASSNYAVQEGRKWVENCKLSPRLGLQLGYPPHEMIRGVGGYAKHVAYTGLIIPDKMLIYCDILEPQLFGDSWTRALRLINTNPSNETPYFGQACSVTFNPPQYIPLQQKHFEAVTIDIKDLEGKPMPFQYGTLSVKLHLRKTRGS